MTLPPFPLLAALALLFILVLAFIRVCRGPTAEDRLLGIQSFGTLGTAVVVLLSLEGDRPGYLDMALVMAMLAAVTIITFTRVLPSAGGPFPDRQAEDHPDGEGS